ncbi:MAG: LemA family protein [Planctomycetota bacterium]
MQNERPIPFTRPDPRRKGAVSRGCLVGLGVGGALLLLLLIVGGTAVGKYNQLKRQRVNVEKAWAEIDNQFKRRFDLIPNLVETVKGAANFERSTLDSVTEARASVGRIQLPDTLPTDPAQLEAYIRAQQNLSGALGRLFAVAENYPQLKATENFRSLQDQIEGTENRITTARRDYIEAVGAYNTTVETFPGNLVAGFAGMEKLAQLSIAPEERAVPKVDFGTGAK